ncbi:MAG: hypothetical protein EBY80_15735 [Actinobacteria bacterium]|nr:hypothetical protein [Actinomycetota bacterium]
MRPVEGLRTVAALYVQPNGCYVGVPGVDPWDEARDARTYAGPHPVVVWSHGRTGLRHIYTKLCEGLATNGYVVVSADHTGDTLFDWLTGANVDDDWQPVRLSCRRQ